MTFCPSPSIRASWWWGSWGWWAVGRSTAVRLDVINLFDNTYQIRNGTGVGVGAPQYGQRRTFLVRLEQKF